MVARETAAYVTRGSAALFYRPLHTPGPGSSSKFAFFWLGSMSPQITNLWNGKRAQDSGEVHMNAGMEQVNEVIIRSA